MTKFRCKIRKFFNFFKFDYTLLILFLLSLFLGKPHIVLLYFLFLFLHEMSHFFVAKKYGYFPQTIRFSFFGASLEGYDDFFFLDELRIIFAGPLFNLVVIIFCYLCFWFYPESYEFLKDVLEVNESILFFNLIPIFPLDAGRIVLCLFSKKYSRTKAVKFVKSFSLFVVILLFIMFLISFFFVFNFMFGLSIVNLCVLLFSSSKSTSYKRSIFVERKLKFLSCGLEKKSIFVKNGTPLFSLLKFIDNGHYFEFLFVDENFKVQARVDEVDLYKNLGLC